MRFLKSLAACLLLLGLPVAGRAAHYYVNVSTGSNAQAGTTPGTAKLDFSGVAAVYSAGDTVTFLSTSPTRTTYSGANNQISNPKSGTGASGRTVIEGEAGQHIYLDGGSARSMIEITSTRSFVTVQNLESINPGEAPAINITSPDGTALVDQTHDIVMASCAARGGAIDTNNGVFSLSQIRDSTFTYCWAWGAGRNTWLAYGCTRIYRDHFVGRWDYWEGDSYLPNDPRYPDGWYNTHDSTSTNFILIDASTNNAGLGERSGLYLIGNTGGISLYTNTAACGFYGGIIFNCPQAIGLHIEGANGGVGNSTNTVKGVAVWKCQYGVSINKNAQNNTLNHISFSSNTFGSFFAGGSASPPVSGTVVKNSQFAGNTNDGLSGSATHSNNNVFGNGTNYSGGASANGTEISSAPGNAYIYRTEAGSPGAGRGDDGGDMGAGAEFLYDVNGATTSNLMLPWPNSSQITADLCDGTYQQGAGLCAMGTPDLNNYLYQAVFGNSGPVPDVSSPTAPGTPSLSVVSSTQLDASWTASTDDFGVAGYYLDVATDSGFSSLVSGYNNKSLGNVLSTSITGLSPLTPYWVRLRAKDAAGNTSSNSSSSNATTLAPTVFQSPHFQGFGILKGWGTAK